MPHTSNLQKPEPLWTDRNDKEKVKNEWASERAAIISFININV